MIRTLFGAILLSFLILMPCFSADLKTYKEAYDKKLGDIATEHGMSLAILADNYVKTLKQLQEAAQKSGDLGKTQACLAEIERFSKEKTLAEGNTKDSVQDIKKVQLAYISETKSLELTRAKKVIALSEQYDKTLGSLQVDLTKQGNLDDATAVKQERKSISLSDDITRAMSVLKAPAPDTPDAEKKAPKSASKEKPGKAPSGSLLFQKQQASEMVLVKSREYPDPTPIAEIALGERRFAKRYDETDVIKIHPFSPEEPSRVDFSAITTNHAGVLKLNVRGDDNADCVVMVKVGETVKENRVVDGKKWTKLRVPFNHQEVVVEGHAGGVDAWSFEYLYLSFDVAKP